MEKEEKLRTIQQNKSLWLYLSQVAHEANNQGQTLQDLVKHVRKLEIRPTKNNLAEVLVKPYIEAAYGKDSTTKLTTKEIEETYDALNLFFSHYWHISLPFPSIETAMLELLGETNESAQGKNAPQSEDNAETHQEP